ncbi:Tumor protein p63-regulated gene 1-like protein [Nibea albiflora]|uniref:Tumor protein p63-regulated gene 1-like protein n=1 Tax=Nibea albiflora TaxID=240163 RepID=A0ACB7ENX0_NIBAL|nr:Tumor protein p63-regulated gene 1-like protein [Nibea albiflora]
MAEAEEEALPCEEQEKEQQQQQQQHQLSSSSGSPQDSEAAAVRTGDIEERAAEDGAAVPSASPPPAARTGNTEERAAGVGTPPSKPTAITLETSVDQFKLLRFFVLRPGTLNQGIKDTEALVDKEIDGNVRSIWLMAEVDHWNNEKERIVFITDKSLMVFKYDFVMFNCDQVQRIPLNFVDRISHGTFSFPKRSLLKREGEGVRVFWDRMREPTFTSRWNPFATDLPSITFTYHPVRNISATFLALCDIHNFREHLKDAAQKAHATKPIPGKANGVLVLKQDLHIDAYVGLMSFLGNQNRLGYCMARGNLGY